MSIRSDVEQQSQTNDVSNSASEIEGTGSSVPNLRLLADQPIESPDDDLLDYHPLAEAIAAIVLDPNTDTPLTISVSAPWGAGKTSLAKLVEYELRRGASRVDAPRPICIWFNAWQHENAEKLGVAFASAVARGLGPRRNPFRQTINPLPTRMLGRRERLARRLLTLVAGVGLVLGLLGVLWSMGLLEGFDRDKLGIAAIPGLPAVALIGLWLWGRVSSLTQALGGYFRDPGNEAERGEMAGVRTQLGRLVTQATQRRWRPARVVIFVDDLDRATPPRSVDLCEAAAQLLDHRGVVVVFIADLPALEAAAESKYSDAAGSYVPRDGLGTASSPRPGHFGRVFVQKLVQFQVSLPPATRQQIKRIASKYASARAATLEPTRGSMARLRTWLKSHGSAFRAIGTIIFLTLLTFWTVGAARSATSWQGGWWVVAALLGSWSLAALIRLLKSRSQRLVGLRTSLDQGSQSVWLQGLALIAFGGVVAFFWAESLAAKNWQWAWWVATGYVSLASLGLSINVVENAAKARRARLVYRVARSVAVRAIGEALDSSGDTDVDVDPYAVLEKIKAAAEGKRLREDVANLTPEIIEFVAELKAELVAIDSVARREAEQEIMAHLTPLPRAAKRLVNRLRFLLHVAQRKELVSSGAVTPAQIGKWAVLSERWPALVWAITLRPALLGELEGLAGQEGGGFSRRVAQLPPSTVPVPQHLAEFLCAGETRLGDVASVLAYLRSPDKNS